MPHLCPVIEINNRLVFYVVKQKNLIRNNIYFNRYPCPRYKCVKKEPKLPKMIISLLEQLNDEMTKSLRQVPSF